MEKILSYIALFFGSIIKFSVGALTVISADLGLGYSIANIIGGIIGIVLFTYLGGIMQSYCIKHYPHIFGKKFTKTNRFLVKVKHRFGLGGIAAITPVLLSIPVGVLFALSITQDKKKILMAMMMSILFWSTVFFLPYFLFNISLIDAIRKLFE